MTNAPSPRTNSGPALVAKARAISWRTGLALLLAITTAYAVGTMVMATGLDEHRPPRNTPATMPILLTGLPVAAALVWVIYRLVVAHRRKQPFDAVILPCIVPLCATFCFALTISCMNTWLDKTGVAMDMTVTDVFTIDRGNAGADRYVVVSLPAEAGGGSAVWFFQRWTDLTKYPIGSRAKIIWHKGYFGWPWCEYPDPRFPGYQAELKQRERRGTAKSARGQFLTGSTYKQKMIDWGVPVEEVADPKDLAAPVQP